MISRRHLLQAFGTTLLASAWPGLSLAASSSTDKRFILIILRGALDGLAAVQPYGDPALPGLRDSLLVPDEKLLKLDSHFALHPSLTQSHALFEAKELEVFHAIATPYRERSHFDGQNVLESGQAKVDRGASGWLNRCAARLAGDRPAALAVGQVLPRVLQGPTTVASWTPDTLPALEEDTLQRLLRLYEEDEFLRARLQAALHTEAMAGETNTKAGSYKLQELAAVAARFLAEPDGPAIAVLEGSGWDTHAGQGGERGTLANRLRELDTALVAIKRGLGERWKDTQVLVVTEFGRTVRVNGTGGTDHGTASVALRAGGSVEGGKMRVKWPGLDSGSLLDGRDLRPTRDVRELYRDAVVHLLGSTEGVEV